MYILCISIQATCDDLRAEKQLISQAEARATQLYQSLLKEQYNQNLVLVNLQTIQVLPCVNLTMCDGGYNYVCVYTRMYMYVLCVCVCVYVHV